MNQRGPSPTSRPRPSARYSIFVGLAFLVVIVIAAVNTLGDGDDGILGGEGTVVGMPLPAFAVPDARRDLTGDANIFQDDCETSENPCPEDERRTPACEVELDGAIRVCDLFDRPLVISFWFTRGGNCLPAQDVVDDVAQRFRGRVNFLSLNVRSDRDEVRRIIRERGWSLPVGHDADGAVSNLFRVGVCPTLAFAYPGGIMQRARALGVDELTTGTLVADVRRLIRESRQRASEDR